MSHFSTVKTKIKDLDCLRKALNDLGYQFTEDEEGVDVKGYRKQKTKAQISIHVSKTYDIGIHVDQKGMEFGTGSLIVRI